MKAFGRKVTLDLGNLKARKDVQGLIKALNYKDRAVQNEVVKALGEIRDPRAVEPLVHELNNKDVDYRCNIIDALGSIGKPAVNSLILALSDKVAAVRKAAVWELRFIHDERAVEPLTKILLKDESVDVRREAADAIGEIVVLGGTQNARFYEICEIAEEPLIQALKDEAAVVRAAAAADLTIIGSEKAVEPLIQALADENDIVRNWAAVALGNIGDEKAVEPLIQMFEDENAWFIRWSVTDALRNIGKPSVQPLIRAYKYGESEVRRGAVVSLGLIGDEAATLETFIQAIEDEEGDVLERDVEPFIQALNSSSVRVRYWAGQALIRIGESAVEPLMDLFKSRDTILREKVVETLKSFKIRDQVVGHLIMALTDDDPEIRRGAAWALRELGDKRAVDPRMYRQLSHTRALEKLEALGVKLGKPPEIFTKRVRQQ